MLKVFLAFMLVSGAQAEPLVQPLLQCRAKGPSSALQVDLFKIQGITYMSHSFDSTPIALQRVQMNLFINQESGVELKRVYGMSFTLKLDEKVYPLRCQLP